MTQLTHSNHYAKDSQCLFVRACFGAEEVVVCRICTKSEVTGLQATREQQSLPVSHGSKHHRSHQQAEHVNRRAETVQPGSAAHQVPLAEGKQAEGRGVLVEQDHKTQTFCFSFTDVCKGSGRNHSCVCANQKPCWHYNSVRCALVSRLNTSWAKQASARGTPLQKPIGAIGL